MMRGWFGRLAKAADDLVAKRLLLTEDADSLVKTAETEGVRNAP